MEGQQTFFRELPALAMPTVIALVGPNGSGKSSIARLLGFTNARAGDRRYRGRLVVDNATSEIVFPLVNADEIAKQIKKHHPDESWDNCNADAAKEAFAVVKDAMAGSTQEVRGRIILATVKGDIHDIGKNIVKVLLENYGYDVIDLGKDVSPETIVETAIREDVKLVGLSALMTTTVVNMEETIRLLREKKPDCRIAVGGAVMTRDYSDRIGADCFGRDAMTTVRYADELCEKGLL
jgi:methylmalonyl-CoA mutase cobalamin-binding domain/chain